MHGPADGQRDADGHVNCEVTGFVLSGAGLPTVYLSGDNASIATVRDIAERVGTVDVAVIFAGAARVPAKERGRPLTMTGQRAAAAAEVLGARLVIPAHVDGWAHFSEGVGEVGVAFDESGILDRSPSPLRRVDRAALAVVTPAPVSELTPEDIVTYVITFLKSLCP